MPPQAIIAATCNVTPLATAPNRRNTGLGPAQSGFVNSGPDRLGQTRRYRSPPAAAGMPADLDIDTEQSDPATSADRIIEHFGLLATPRHDRYPEPAD